MDIKIPYTPRKHQAYIHKQIDKHRWNVLVCNRRFGKTVAVLNHLIRSALTSKNKNPRYAYISPTFKQSKAIKCKLTDFENPILNIRNSKI